MEKEIKRILVEGYGWIRSDEEGNLEEFAINGEMARVRWFRKGKTEFNGKYVIMVEYVNPLAPE